MFARFTERAREVVVLAQDEALDLKHNYIGPEHILLGLLSEKKGLACIVLNSLDIHEDEIRMQVARITGVGETKSTSKVIPFTPHAKKVLEMALREALSLGHNYIGTEHILLGLVRENESVATKILLDFDANADKIRNEIIRSLSGSSLSGTLRKDPILEDQLANIMQLAYEAIDNYNFGQASDLLHEGLKKAGRVK